MCILHLTVRSPYSDFTITRVSNEGSVCSSCFLLLPFQISLHCRYGKTVDPIKSGLIRRPWNLFWSLLYLYPKCDMRKKGIILVTSLTFFLDLGVCGLILNLWPEHQTWRIQNAVMVDRVGFEPTTTYVSSAVIGMQGRYSTGLNYRPTLN